MLALIGLTEIGILLAALSVAAAFIMSRTRGSNRWHRTLSAIALAVGSVLLGAYAASQWDGLNHDCLLYRGR